MMTDEHVGGKARGEVFEGSWCVLRRAAGRRPPPTDEGAGGGEAGSRKEAVATSGEFLRRCREDQGLSLEEISSRTKIGVCHLQRIEEEDFHFLPARVYLKGFLTAYAREVRLSNPRAVADQYLLRYDAILVPAAPH